MLFLVFGNLRMKLFDFFENSMGTIAEKAGIKNGNYTQYFAT